MILSKNMSFPKYELITSKFLKNWCECETNSHYRRSECEYCQNITDFMNEINSYVENGYILQGGLTIRQIKMADADPRSYGEHYFKSGQKMYQMVYKPLTQAE